MAVSVGENKKKEPPALALDCMDGGQAEILPQHAGVDGGCLIRAHPWQCWGENSTFIPDF